MSVRLGFSGGDPGGRRRAARGRGAGGGRRVVPAQVLRRVRADEARGPDDPVRDPRHERGGALLRPRDAARARRGGARSAPPDEIARLYSEVNFGHTAGAERPATARRAACASPAPGARTRAASAWSRPAQGERLPRLLRGRVRARRRGPACSRSPSATTCGTRSSWPPARTHGLPGSFAAGERGDGALRVRELARPQPLHAHAVGLRGAGRRRSSTRAEDLAALIVEAPAGHRRRGRHADRAGGGARVSAADRAPRATAGRPRSATTCAASGA